MWEKTCKDHDPKRNRQVISWPLFADRCRRKIDDHPVTREMEARVFYRSLDAFPTLLHGRVWQADDDYGRQTIAEIHFHFNDDAFKTNDSTGIHTRKHVRSVDEAE